VISSCVKADAGCLIRRISLAESTFVCSGAPFRVFVFSAALRFGLGDAPLNEVPAELLSEPFREEARDASRVFVFVSITSKPCEDVALSFALFLVCPNRDSSTSLVLDTTRYVERVIAGGWRGNGGGSARRPLGREPETEGRIPTRVRRGRGLARGLLSRKEDHPG
jgi:hypothetical protein